MNALSRALTPARCTIALLGLSAALAVQAQAAPPIKTGLWEIQPKGMGPGGMPPELAAQMSKMPPEARKQMEAMMRSRGVEMSAGGQMALKVCLDEESLRKDTWNQAREGCTHEVTERSNAVWRWKGQCAQPPSTLEGETRFTGATAYTSSVRVTTERKGKTATQEFSAEAKWLGADCKGVPPIQATQKNTRGR
jgi:hypothetical protein